MTDVLEFCNFEKECKLRISGVLWLNKFAEGALNKEYMSNIIVLVKNLDMTSIVEFKFL